MLRIMMEMEYVLIPLKMGHRKLVDGKLYAYKNLYLGTQLLAYRATNQ